MTEWQHTLLAWYASNGRELPWRREDISGYEVWLSEIILQQTTIRQGTDYYLRFIERFPTVEDLAKAEEDEVLRLWQGLGYYSRARNLHIAAQQVVEERPTLFASRIANSNTYATIRSLKGVGDYTAAAIASIVYGLPHAVVDGNVYRVLSRYFGIATPIDTTQGKKVFATLAQELITDGGNTQFGTYNQAIMDFGALQCTPHSPVCEACPLSSSCEAYANNLVSEYPVKSKRIKPQEVRITYYLVEDGKSLLIRKRGNDSIWKGLYELPTHMPTKERHPSLIGTFKHQLTHRTIICTAYHVRTSTAMEGYARITWEELDNYALPRLIENIIAKYNENRSNN